MKQLEQGSLDTRETSRPAWARELKHKMFAVKRGMKLSRPAWARELKHGGRIMDIAEIVAPRVGA